MKKLALISVSDKTGIVHFTKKLINLNWEIISTGGTKKALEKGGLSVISIEDITDFPEMLDGRVKTLHPKIHGGLLSLRQKKSHQEQVKKHQIRDIDLVVVNLYPFVETTKKANASHSEIIENIDIGGPSMLRSAGKNYQYVTVVVDPEDYSVVINELTKNNKTSLETRERLATKVFNHTAFYDAKIAEYLNRKTQNQTPKFLTIPLTKYEHALRYGENPHQSATFYLDDNSSLSFGGGQQLQGKTLSYNNIQDGNAAINIVREFNEAVIVGLKHMNPCGIGIDPSPSKAWKKSYEADPVSIFGGIVASNMTIDGTTATEMTKIFLEVIIAEDFTKEALEIFSKKKNLRLIKMTFSKPKHLATWQYTSVNGGMLRQEWDRKNVEDCKMEIVTKEKPSKSEMADLIIGQKIVKHVKSNAIVLVKNRQLVGVGAGQMNRVGAAEIAIRQAKDLTKGATMASDAFFPFNDVVKMAAKHGIKAIIQPGGSIRDKDSIEACNENGISMVFTKMRHFKH